MTAATSSTPRYLELDALRGFAVMGILLMNIISFSMPDMAYFSPGIYGGTDTPDIIAWTLSFIFVDGKMRGLFTLLFGASLMLVVERAEFNGQSSAKTHYSRMFWLAIFGLSHFFFLWYGDILFLYAVIGCIAYSMTGMASAKLFRIGLLIYVLGFVANLIMMGALLFMEYQAAQPGASAAVVQQFSDAMADFTSDNDLQIAETQSGFLTLLQTKLEDSLFDPLVNISFNFTETLPLMLIGMALYKDGFFTGGWRDAKYRQWGIRLTLIGTILMLPIAAYLIATDFDLLKVLNASLAWTEPALLLMTIGYAAFLILLIRTYAASPWMYRIASVGRTAFTNYLGTSLLMTFIFYGWGLGYFGQIDRAEVYFFVPLAWALMLLWSKPWLQRFRYGPLEWLWRSLARRALQPMRI